MTHFLARLLGRLPIGWLQLTHNRGRLLAALAGVTFANVLVFVQLGIMGALNTTIVRDYQLIDADIMISAEDANTLTEGSNAPRQLMYRALSHPSVGAASPLFISNAQFNDEQGEVTFQVIGFDPDVEGIMAGIVNDQRTNLRVSNGVLADSQTRGLSPEIAEALEAGRSV
ncbi:MAG: ABC transporter permease, partial [Pseudomonadota bacterium]